MKVSRWQQLGNDDLKEVAREVERMKRQNGFDAKSSIGRLLLDRCYGGSIARWRDQRKNKKDCVRRLAEQCDCGSRKSLEDAIFVCIALDAMPWVLETQHLTVTDLVRVRTLKEELRTSFLKQAEAKRWSTRVLYETVVAHNRKAGENRGSSSTSLPGRADKLATRSRDAVAELGDLLDPEQPSDFSADQLDHLLVQIDETRAGLETARGQVLQLRAGVSSPVAAE